MRPYGSSFLFIALLVAICACNRMSDYSQNSVLVSDQLSNRNVLCFAQDSLGYVWIGTAHGLNRYNSDNYHQYLKQDDESASLPSNTIHALFVDPSGRLWVGTGNGACFYLPETDSFQHVHNRSQFNQVHQVWQDSSGRILFNLIEELCEFDSDHPDMKTVIRHFDPTEEYINFCYPGQDGLLWSVTGHRIRAYDERTYELVFEEVLEPRITDSNMTEDGVIDISTDSGPLSFDIAHRRLSERSLIGGHSEDNTNEDVSTRFVDKDGNLWTGTKHHGFQFRAFGSEPEALPLISGMEDIPVVSLTSAPDGSLFLLSADHQVFLYKDDFVSRLNSGEIFSGMQPNDVEASVFVDSASRIWVISDRLYQMSLVGTSLVIRHAYPSPPQGKASAIAEDIEGNLWVVYGNAPFVSVLRSGNEAFDNIPVEPLSSLNLVYTLLPLTDGRIVLGMALSNPLILDVDTGQTESIPLWDDSDRMNLVSALCLDRGGKVWIGTYGSGVFRYDLQKKELAHLEGIPSKEVCSILEDGDGRVWISTLSGLYRFNWTYGDYSLFGNASDQFNVRSGCSTRSGSVIFGQENGVTVVSSASLTEDRSVPLYFEDLHISNQLVRWNPGEDLELGFRDNTFSISYAALNYSSGEKLHFRYKLNGFHNNWIDSRTGRTIQLTNIPAGRYTLIVQAYKNDNDALAESSLQIRVHPAPWNTWWAYSLYTLAVLLALGTFYWSRVNSIKQREAAKRAELEKEQEKRINQVNMSFFANMSHEFRTPLTMISGPVTQMEKGQATPQMLSAVKWNVARMLRLVNQLMDFNKLENDTLKLQVAKDDVVALIKQTAAAYAFSIGEKGVSFNGFGLEDSFTAWVDADKLDKILSNLLSNAMKFTPQGGEITFSFDVVPTESGRWMKMMVADNGPKIPPESLERIFDRYYQVENHHNYGTGIGLYFARKLAELHHGSLKCENLAGDGLVFTLLLPADDVYTESEKVDHNPEKLPIFLETAEFKTADSAPQHSQSVLIVDDDPDIVAYEHSLLAPQYNVRKAFNAQSALEMLRAEMPDIIISDVSMPGMDGYTLCRAIKEDADICHIPVILVTAKTTVENQIEGLHQGADAYVTKPFDPEYLLAVIKSQLDNRERLRGILGKATTVEDIKEEEAALSPQDSALMKELYELMEKELDNDMLNINSITDQLHISRSKFYYKIRALTGENPNSFFKNYKLNRAKELLMDGRYNISEVADMTGFSNPSVFGRNFKARFGVTPTEWCNNQKTS